jgi:hypothetical protein
MPGDCVPEDDLPEIVRRYIDAYNRLDVDAMLACLSEDVAFQNLSGGVVTDAVDGKAAFAEMAREAAGIFVVREQSPVQAMTVASTTIVRIAYRATPAVDLPNGWRAGDVVTLSGCSLFEVTDGRICRLIDES